MNGVTQKELSFLFVPKSDVKQLFTTTTISD